MGRMRRAKAKLISMAPGMMARAVSASRQFSVNSNAHGDEQADDRDGGRHDGHLQQPGRRVHVAGQAGQDAAGLHVPQLGQRQVQQPVEERPAERQHHPHVQQALAVVLETLDQAWRGRSRRRTGRPPGGAGSGATPVSSPVFSSTRSMMNRMNSGSIISSPAASNASRRTARRPRNDAARASAGTRADTHAACRAGNQIRTLPPRPWRCRRVACGLASFRQSHRAAFACIFERSRDSGDAKSGRDSILNWL